MRETIIVGWAYYVVGSLWAGVVVLRRVDISGFSYFVARFYFRNGVSRVFRFVVCVV